MKFSGSVASFLTLSFSLAFAKESQLAFPMEGQSNDVVKPDMSLKTYTVVGPTDLYSCSSYSASNTNYATQNYYHCYFTACGGTALIISGCGCTGDSYVTLFTSGAVITYGDDGCGIDYCTYFEYMVPGSTSDCYDYDLHEGCYSSYSCSATMTVMGSHYYSDSPTETPSLSFTPSEVPSEIPTEVPSLSFTPSEVPSEIPSEVPSLSFTPSEVPSETPSQAPTPAVISCSPFSASHTNSDQTNYVVCSFVGCGGTFLEVNGCNCAGDEVLALYDESGSQVGYDDDYCSGCSYFILTPPGTSSDCQIYELHEGCFGSNSCYGTVVVTGNVVAITDAPTEPPSPAPSVSSAPTTGPFNCPAYSASNTNFNSQGYSVCSFSGCGGDIVTVNGCDCNGDQYLILYDESNLSVISSDDACGSCSAFTYTVPGNPGSCQIYTIHEGCWGSGACSGTLAVSGATNYVPSPSSEPTYTPSFSSTEPPTDAPAVTPLTRPPPMVYSVVIPVVIVSAVLFTSMFVYFCRAGSSAASAGRVYVTAYEGVEMT